MQDISVNHLPIEKVDEDKIFKLSIDYCCTPFKAAIKNIRKANPIIDKMN